jgi:hypothetical protein
LDVLVEFSGITASEILVRVSFPSCGTNITAEANDKLAKSKKAFIGFTIIIWHNIISLCFLIIYLSEQIIEQIIYYYIYNNSNIPLVII